MINNITYKDSEEFSLVSDSQGRVIIPEPINFEDGNRNIYERDKDSKGFLTTRSNNLEFYGAATEFLQKQVALRGVAEDVRLEKRIKSDDRIDERWRETSPVWLDLGDLEIKERKGGGDTCKTKSTQGGLKKLIDSRKSDEYDLTALFDLDGKDIEPLETETVFLESRKIFLRSKLKSEGGRIINANVSGGDSLNARSVPFSVEINSDSGNIDNVLGVDLNAANNSFASLSSLNIGNCWLTESSTNKTLTLNGRIELTLTRLNAPSGANRMSIVIYNENFNVRKEIQLTNFNPLGANEVISYDFNDYELEILKGDSVAFGLLSDTLNGISYRVSDTEIEITEDSVFLDTEARCLTYKQALNRVLYIMTGKKDLVVSDWLDNGDLSEDVISSGFWIRQFPFVIDEDTEEERKIPFNLSLENILKHIEALTPKAWWTENIGGKEYFRIEPYKYTQQDFTGIPFSEKKGDKVFFFEASEIKRKYLKKNFYSTLEFGSEKGGDDYEEVFGLRSVNGKATYNTVNKNQDSSYSKLSPFRLGDVDVELPRRKPYSEYSEEDTRYDSDIMCIRAKKGIDKYYLKKWQDVFDVPPKGVYNVDSAYNLDLTPARLLLNHGFVINSALYHYPNSSIVFASSNCNSSFISRKTGEVELEESKPIKHTRLDLPRVKPVKVELTLQVTQEIEDYITGQTDGAPNWFGLVKINTGQGIESFRMIKSDLNKSGKHELIEAYL